MKNAKENGVECTGIAEIRKATFLVTGEVRRAIFQPDDDDICPTYEEGRGGAFL